MNLWLVFLTGLSVGSISCLAVQGTLLASTIATRNNNSTRKIHPLLPTVWFLVAKLISYTILGFVLGFLGKTIGFSNQVFIIAQFLAGLYLIALGLNLLGAHPIFRYAVINPPKMMSRFIRSRSKSAEIFAPALLGILTIFIPCGVTLAMETVAITSANPYSGAAIMSVFTLGTSPIFLGLGVFTDFLTKRLKGNLLRFAALVILYFGVTSINGSLVLVGSPITLQKLYDIIPIEIDLGGDSNPVLAANLVNGTQIFDIQVTGQGYSPSYLTAKLGLPIKLNLHPAGNLGCTTVFNIPKLKISKTLVSGENTSVEFTPTNKGDLTWSCSMGMYTGKLRIG